MATNIVAIVGSLQTTSINRNTANTVISLAPEGMTISILDVSNVPLFNGDVEAQGKPASVVAVDEAVAAADGVILFTPEYNGSWPAVTKNVYDWLTRPPKMLIDKPIAAVATAPGPRAGLGVLTSIETVLDHMPDNYPRYDSFGIGKIGEKVGDDGMLNDEETLTKLTAWIAGFGEFIAAQ